MSKGFFKTSRTSIIAFRDNSESSFTKSASFQKTSSHFQEEGTAIDIQASLDIVADAYKISKNPDDYVYVISRALTADVPNENHDCFPAEELLRFDTKHGCRVFQTFINKPNHINHRADDPTQARGVIIDAHYNELNPDDQFVEILVAVDRTKDKKLATGIENGDINSMSMGCYAELCVCSVCGHEAESTEDLCPKHIRGGKKGREFDGAKSFEKCYDVCFNEESFVDEPADPTALVSEVMKIKASIEAISAAENIGYESELFILNNKLSEIQKSISELNNKTASKEATNDDKLENKEETTMASKNPYEKLSELKKTSANPSDWKSTDSGKGNPPKEWSNPGKGDGTTPSEWKIAGLAKTALDDKAKSYWTNYYKNGYGAELIKDLKRKKIGSSTDISLEQMKVLDSKFATIMADLSIESIKPSTVFKLAELCGIEFETVEDASVVADKEAAKDSKEESELVTRKIDDPSDKKWKSIDASINTLTLDLIGSEWHIREADNSLMVIQNVDELDAAKFESDEFAMSIMDSLTNDGAAVTASTFKVALYPAVPLEPSFVDDPDDDLAGDMRKKPSSGAEEGGTDDLEDVNRSDVKEKGGVGDGVELDMKTSAVQKEAVDIDYAKAVIDTINNSVGQESVGAKKILTRITSSPGFKEKVEGILDLAMKNVSEERQKASHVASISDNLKDFLLVSYTEALDKEDDSLDMEATLIQAMDDFDMPDMPAMESEEAVEEHEEMKEEIKEIKEDIEGDEEEDKEASVDDTDEEDKEASVEEDDKKEAGVLDDNENDLAVVVDESKKGSDQEGEDDLDGVDRESKADTIYSDGSDDLKEEKGTVVKVGEKEMKEVKQVYATRFKRAITLAIRRASLNIINNELKAAFHDTLTSEMDLQDGYEYAGMDSSMAKSLIERAFVVGADKFFADMAKEADKILTLPEEALVAFEEDITNLHPVEVSAEITSEYEEEALLPSEVSAKREEMNDGNPVFKSSSVVESNDRFAGLKGAFGEAVVTDAMKKYLG